MLNEELVKCPVCGIFTRIDKPELRAALNDPKIRLQIEEYVAGLVPSALVGVAARATGAAELPDRRTQLEPDGADVVAEPEGVAAGIGRPSGT